MLPNNRKSGHDDVMWGKAMVWGGIAAGAAGLLLLTLLPAIGQDRPNAGNGNMQAELEQARAQAARARDRVAEFERDAKRSGMAAQKAAIAAAALAAKVQQAEAIAAAARAELALVTGQRRKLETRLAAKRQPIVELTAALQSLARRPAVLGLLRPASLRDSVHLSAILAGTVPRIDASTSALKADVEEARRLQGQSRLAVMAQRKALAALAARRRELAALAAQERIAARRATGSADREAARAFALADKARSLGALIDEFEQAGSLRQRLAQLPGPLERPVNPAQASIAPAQAGPAAPGDSPPAPYRLPVLGRIAAGFGETSEDGLRSDGLTLIPRPDAQVVSPAAGRIAFAGPYRGFGEIVIIEHTGGWMSLVTGLGNTTASVGEQVVAGSPLGQATASGPQVTLELRHKGKPVNPLQYAR